MNIVKPYAKLLDVQNLESGIALLKKIEWCGRISHRSEEAQTEDSWQRFIQSVVLNHGDWSIVEHGTATVDMVVDRGITHELVRHRLFCLDGDAELYFDLPAGQQSGHSRRGYRVRIEDIYSRWENGIQQTRNPSSKARGVHLVDANKHYTSKELAIVTQKRRESINTAIRLGYLNGSTLERLDKKSPNKRISTIKGSDWIAFVNKKTSQCIDMKKRISAMRLRSCNEDTGEIEYTHITNVVKSGIKPVFQVKLDNGYMGRMTMEHRVLTENGWRRLKDVGSALIAVNGMAPGTMLNRVGSLRGMRLTDAGRASISKSKRGPLNPHWKGGVRTWRQQVSAWVSSVSREIYAKYDFTCQTCGTYEDLSSHHINPVWHAPSEAFNSDNLIVLCRPCNRRLYYMNLEMLFMEELKVAPTREFWTRHQIKIPDKENKPKGQGNRLVRDWARIVSMQYLGERMTYDLEVSGPYHNFIADGFVVHNSFTQESSRFVNYEKKMPASFIAPDGLSSESARASNGEQIELSQMQLWEHAINTSEYAYKKLILSGVSPQIARSVFPTALAARIVVTGNLRNWRHFFLMRTTKETHPQMREVTIPLLIEFQTRIPLIFDDITPLDSQRENLKKAR